MDTESFAAERGQQLSAVDDEFRPLVREALEAYARGVEGWADELVVAASVVWLEHFLAEAPHANGDRSMPVFKDEVEKSLKLTSQPDGEPTDGQVERVTAWLSVSTVNSATTRGAAARGVRFKKWVTMGDPDVRAMHRDVNGQIVPIAQPFSVGGVELQYPGEPVGPPDAWINCRCVMQPAAAMGDAAVTPTTFMLDADLDHEADGPYSSDEGERDGMSAAAGFEMAEVIADVPSEVDDERVDDEDVPDEFEDDEEAITEIPVHGVLAPEGVATGDGRGFRDGALSTRALPIPLRYEVVGAHGGNNTSEVVTVGRVDEAWRDEASGMWRFRGALVLSRQATPEVIDGIIDGTVRGVSIDADDMELDLSDFEEDPESGRVPMSWFKSARVAGLTIVPIPAFEEAYIALGPDFEEDMSDEDRKAAEAALAACGCYGAPSETVFRDYSAEERKKMAEDGRALPDGSFPIADEEDLRNAIQSIGRAGDPEEAKRHIKKRARALGKDDLIPDDWSAEAGAFSAEEFAPGTKDGPGWITHPIPTSRIRRYWVSGKGAAKIRWGAPGDFNRCRSQLAKYVQNPDWLAGLCANMHKEALGFWPSTHRAKKGMAASGAKPAPILTLVASGGTVYPAEWFQNPGLDRAVPMWIDRESRRVYGYIAEWGECHIGIDGACTTPPQSYTDYAYFRKGVVSTTEGDVMVGTLTYGIGHPNLFMRASAASAHYDKTDAVRAYVNVGEDANGIWFAGVLAPWVTDEDIDAMRAIGALSGDWRDWQGNGQLELVGAVVVNTPGFQLKPALAAAGGHQIALVAAGVVQEPKPVEQEADTEVEAARLAMAERITSAREKIRANRLALARNTIAKEW